MKSANPGKGSLRGSAPSDAAQYADANGETSNGLPGGLGKDGIAKVLRFSRPRHFATGEQVVVEGAVSRCLYFVESGSVEVSYRVGETPIIVALIGPSSFFGEIGFFDGVSRVRNIRVTEDSVIRFFDVASLGAMRAKDPVLYGDFVVFMAQSICDKFRRVLEEREPITAHAASLSAGRRSFEEAGPVPKHILQTDEWRSAIRLVEDFKGSLFDLSYQLQRDTGVEAPRTLADGCRRVMDDFNRRLEEVSRLLETESIGDYVWGYVFKEIFPYFMRSRFAERAYYKPSGYAGDYLTMEMIYANLPDGDGKLGRLIDGWCLGSTAARAVRGRRKFLKDQIEHLCGEKHKKQRLIRIMNLGCGASRELFDFLAECDYSEQIEAVCIDADPGALEYLHMRVDPLSHRASIRLMSDNVVRWALGRIRHNFGLHDLIYSGGLTDYLDDRIFASLVIRSYECLVAGGTLVIGNFGHGNDNKAFLDHILKWRLIHRRGEELLDIFSRTPFGCNVEILSEENGVNLFAVATKTE